MNPILSGAVEKLQNLFSPGVSENIVKYSNIVHEKSLSILAERERLVSATAPVLIKPAIPCCEVLRSSFDTRLEAGAFRRT
ncbi:hypothetical protein KRR38_17710 [Novosphingobium sp. G106]|uniref:hypothetical protein n=1 Tax=Novosphingobium sp. G106 TaxID=2849500 RepID=UPI001C2D3CFE|nr:hypothetical protein [Novosphingobium sp. G106]MBV1689461.1 hypothetical protein [Novosphingobium sp. G106]